MRIAICGEDRIIHEFHKNYFEGKLGNDFQFDSMLALPINRLRPVDIDFLQDPIEIVERYRDGRIDAVILAISINAKTLAQKLVRQLKLNRVEKIGIFYRFSNSDSLCWLEPEKFFMPYLEFNVVDGCNLNCKGCSHFSPLYDISEVYNLNEFRRDIHQMSRRCDIISMKIVGGEPFLLKNLDEYLKIIRKFFPEINLRILTNGMFLPTASKDLLEYISKNKIGISISEYPLMMKLKPKISETLESFGIPYTFLPKGIFRTLLRKDPGKSNPVAAMKVCPCQTSRFLRDGNLYKCPVDALHSRFNQKFPNARQLPPEATSIDIFAENFTTLIDLLDEPVEMCAYCPEHPDAFEWKIDSNPVAENWIG